MILVILVLPCSCSFSFSLHKLPIFTIADDIVSPFQSESPFAASFASTSSSQGAHSRKLNHRGFPLPRTQKATRSTADDSHTINSSLNFSRVVAFKPLGSSPRVARGAKRKDPFTDTVPTVRNAKSRPANSPDISSRTVVPVARCKNRLIALFPLVRACADVWVPSLRRVNFTAAPPRRVLIDQDTVDPP